MSMITVEKTQTNDFLAIAALDRDAWTDNSNAQYIPDGEHAWRIWCEHSVMFSARSGDDLVGAILAFYCEQGIYCVHKVMVSKQHRGAKIGCLLFDALLIELDSKKTNSFLTVDPENSQAISLYNKWGYETTRQVNGYYRSNEHRNVMTRSYS